MSNAFTYRIFFLVFLLPYTAFTQQTIQKTFDWKTEPFTLTIGDETYERWEFDGAVLSEMRPSLPKFATRFSVPTFGDLNVEVVDARYEPLERRPSADDEFLGERLLFTTSVERNRDRFVGKLSFVPIVQRGGGFEKLIDVTLRVTHTPTAGINFRGPDDYATTSELSQGENYKIAISETGIYKLTYGFLKDELGIPLDNIDPRNLRLMGNGSGMVPHFAQADRVDDLAEIPIRIVGEADGRFDSGDYLLFYGEGPDQWTYDPDAGIFNMQKNVFDARNHYFIKVGSGNGARISTQSSLAATAFTTSAFSDFARFEEEEVNLLHEWTRAEGSGKRWFGDYFKVAREKEYDNLFSFPNLLANNPVHVKSEMALRSKVNSRYKLFVNGQPLQSTSASGISAIGGSSENIVNYAVTGRIDGTVNLNQDAIDIKVEYPPVANTSEGWLDFIQLNARRALSMVGDQLVFRDPTTLVYPTATFQLSNASDAIEIWDVTNPLAPQQQEATLSAAQYSFGVTTTELRTFVAFHTNQGFLTAEAVGLVPNQNLHAIGVDPVDMVIIYHPDFEAAAQRLAQHRSDHSDLSVSLAPIEQIYNEFSSGSVDPTAIRDFARMLYERSDRFRYLLLMGDGSFDTRDLLEHGGNYIPVYETDSFNPVFSYPTDDYYAILNGPDPSDPLKGDLNIAVGRLPVNTPEEAEVIVGKLITYDTAPTALRDWRNRLLFVGDDEDGNTHTGDADAIAERVNNEFPDFNIDKLYLDAFPQVSTPAGNRIPTVNEAINRNIFKGVLAVTYLGHGGPKGWAQERVLSIADIQKWSNAEQMPLLVTATCSFTGFDDPNIVSGGEEAFLNPKGGAVGLMTTTRAVYAGYNATLTRNTLLELFAQRPEGPIGIGEVMVKAKNPLSGATETNSRKFLLIGDPAMQLAIPSHRVMTTRINTHDVADGQADTLRAFQKVTIEGIITRENGDLYSDFNGILYPTIYDKKLKITTLAQDDRSPIFNFTVRKNVIFKGRASVNNGRFSFTFVMPKDINFEYGVGKISYYASDESKMTDANGQYDNIIIGGASNNLLADDQGPQVEVFMNTEDFVFGGMTDTDPTLLVKLQDDNGINVVGNSIGHDLEGILDENTSTTYLLNDFYEAEIDDYTKGEVRYPLSDLEEGRHQIRVQAWDVANNSSEGMTEFIVSGSAEIALRHVLNYPNPFTDRTCFQFDHTLANQELEVLIQIYTVSGRLVKTIEQQLFSDGAIRLDDCIQWDGRDDFGDRLARGVYLYKVKVRANSGGGAVNLSGESEFEKLVILK